VRIAFHLKRLLITVMERELAQSAWKDFQVVRFIRIKPLQTDLGQCARNAGLHMSKIGIKKIVKGNQQKKRRGG
jgi:hypothetical protein